MKRKLKISFVKARGDLHTLLLRKRQLKFRRKKKNLQGFFSEITGSILVSMDGLCLDIYIKKIIVSRMADWDRPTKKRKEKDPAKMDHEHGR